MCVIKAAFDNCIRARSERSDLIIERFYVLKNRVKNDRGDRSARIQLTNAAIVDIKHPNLGSLSAEWVLR